MTGWASPEQHTAPVEPEWGQASDNLLRFGEWPTHPSWWTPAEPARPRWTRADWLLLAVCAAFVLAVAVALWRK